MSICGNDFIPIIITIVCCGLLFVYCNSRLAELKNAVEKQNRVLTSFIASIQHDIRSSGGLGLGLGVGGGAQKLASDEAMAAVKRFEQDKIVVSDDENDSDDDDSENDSESDSESDDSLSVSDTESDHGHEQLNLNMEQLLFEQVPRDMKHANVTELGDDVLNIVEVINMDDTNVHESDSSSSSSDESQSSVPVNYESMKIEELRKIVTDRNLATKEESKKLKKPELLSLLKK
jgi:hypothetical protein